MYKPILAVLLLAAVPAAAAVPADPWHAEARTILKDSVGMRTSLGHTPVKQLVDYLRARFRAAGVSDAAMTVVPVDQTQALVVRIAGRDRARKAILLSSHMDVVDANPKDWTRSPFVLVEENGYFYGRGTDDTKGGGMAQLAVTIERIAKSGKRPARDLIFAFVGDEETTMHTTLELAGKRKALIDAEYEIDADGANGVLDHAYRPVIYHIDASEKTYADYSVTVTNPGGHSSLPRKHNAIYELADALKGIQAYRFPVQSNAITRSSLEALGKLRHDDLGRAMTEFAAHPVEGVAAERLSADPTYVGQIRTTCVATLLEGGHAPNALPARAVANVNCRIFPGTSPDDVMAALQRAAGPVAKVAINGKYDVPRAGPVSPPNPALYAAVEKAVHQHYPGVPIAYAQPAGASDGREFRIAGIPSYGTSGLFQRDEDEFAHGLNERVRVDAFYNSVDYMWTLVTELAPLG